MSVFFAPFRLDLTSEQLWREERAITLRSKTFAVLRHLVEHPEKVVTRNELLDVVGAGTVVRDTVLKSCIRELRKALGDDVQAPRYIATVHRQGYRFIGPLSSLPSQSLAPTEMGDKQGAVEEKKVTRKLVAILSADVQGYSRLMSENELATIRMLTAYREAMTALITQYRGRVIDAPGDNLLAEFASAVDAVEAAVAIQSDFKTRNAEFPPQRQMHYRIGINVGDVVVEGGRLYGDGVNIAARLEALAEGGGVCLSRSVYEQIKNKVALAYEYVGERRVKHIAEPVSVYRIKFEPVAVSPQNDTPALQNASYSTHQTILSTSSSQHRTPIVVGRDAELAHLQGWLEKALHGERQMVFISGEPGIGKTTLVDLFLAGIQSDSRILIGRGHCLEQYGEGEAYLPILEAFGRLCREPGAANLLPLLTQYAATWLMQMPAVLAVFNAEELANLRQQTQGATRQRMLREMAEAIEAITVETPLVLLLEDLHWSDYSTVEFLSYLAQRQERARLLVIGTYRPTDLGSGHPLKKIKNELHIRQRCEEVPLTLLSGQEVTAYVAKRFPDQAVSPGLASMIHRRTEGNALFMVNVVNELANQGLIVAKDGKWEIKNGGEGLSIPESLRLVIELKFEHCSAEEQQVLEAASVEGREFTAGVSATAVGRETLEVEECCAGLVRQGQLVQGRETQQWPDGTITARYGFGHSLYQEVIYDRLTPGKRAQLHLRIGQRLEQAYGDRTREIATELALHFERGRDYHRAVQHLQQAAEKANQRCAYHESISHLTRAIILLKHWPEGTERIQQELTLQISLGVALMAIKGYAAPEAKTAYDRARELCQQIGDTPQLVPVLKGLSMFYYVRAELSVTREIGEQLVQLAQGQKDQTLLSEAHLELGGTLFHLGEFMAALGHLEQGSRLYDPQKHHAHVVVYGQDPGVSCLCRAAHALWLLGYPEQALRKIREALTLARESAHPHSLAYALNLSGLIYQFCRDVQAVQEQAEAAVQLATHYEFPIWKILGDILRGWGLALQGQAREGIVLIEQGITSWRAIGAEISLPYSFSLLAEVYGKAGIPQKGLEVLNEALVLSARTRDRFWESELYRLKGELLLTQGGKKQKANIETDPRSLISTPQGEAEAYFLKAIDTTRKQQAKSLELRAVMSLSRLWQQQGIKDEARQMLAEIYGWFTEGFDTTDLREAKTLLEELR